MPKPKKKKLTLTETINKEVPETGYKAPKKIIYFYAIPLSLLIVLGILYAILFFMKVHVVYKIVTAIFTIPPLLVSFVFITIRLYIDRNRITGKLTKFTSNNFIIAKFFLPQKRTIKRVCMLNPDRISFSIGKQDYIVDREKVWINQDGHPECNYIPNLPNPIGFEFERYLSEFQKYFDSGKPQEFIDSSGNVIDLSLTSENLAQYKRSKMFKDFQKQEQPELVKMVFGLMILVGVAIGAIVLILVVGR